MSMERFKMNLNREESKMEKTPSVNVEFEDLSYFVSIGNSNIGRKQILKSLNGKFLAGQLTGILGASGAGKTTLLNVLAGYVVKGSTGKVKINGNLRNLQHFYALSTYIMQENLIQPHLTVQEEMITAADLKLGNRIGASKKLETILEILNLFGLSECRETLVENISGGEKKRLSIALELLSNPPIIFLDEPTSGLDSVAIKQCVDVLKSLTNEGRTVVCTIHQPSRSVMQQFDQVYFMANGQCVYNGPVVEISQFLESVNLECPLTSSHAEFVIEAVEINPAIVPLLVKATNNGKNNALSKNSEVNDNTLVIKAARYPCSFGTQVAVLLQRMWLQQKKNTLAFWIQFLNHILCGVLHGGMFYGIGNNANHAMTNFKMYLCVLMFFLYTYVMTPILLFPFEVKILKREHFNGWYSLKAYYLAVIVRNLPILLILGSANILITYVMTDQPFELCRFIRFALAALMVGLIAEALGMTIGAIFNCRNGSIFGPALLAPWIFFTIYGLGYSNRLKPAMRLLMGTSFVRYGIVGMTLAVMTNRAPFECPEEALFCYYENSNTFLKDLDVAETTYALQICSLVIFLIIFRLIGYLALRIRLNPDWTSSIVTISKKLIGEKNK